MHIGIILIVFFVIFISELPDKSFFASLILGSRYPGKIVWLGAASAFLIHVIIATVAGRLLTLLPHRILALVVAILFLLGASLLFFGKHGLESEPKAGSPPKHVSYGKIYATAFSVTFLGEWGDITQLTTANYTAHYHDPWSVGIGSFLALISVTALAITAGKKALKLIPVKLLQRISAFILVIFALLSLRGI